MPLQLNRPGVRRKRALNKHQSKHIPGMVEAGQTLQQIADYFNISDETAARYIKAFAPGVEGKGDKPDEATEADDPKGPTEADLEEVKAFKAKAAKAKAAKAKAAKAKAK